MSITRSSAFQQSSLKDVSVLLPPTSPPILSCTHNGNCFVKVTNDRRVTKSIGQFSAPSYLPCQQLTRVSPPPAQSFFTGLSGHHALAVLLSLGPLLLGLLCSFPSSPQPVSVGLPHAQSLICFPFHVPSPGDLIHCHCVKCHLHADDSKSSICSSDLSPDLHIPKSNFLVSSYTSKSNERVEFNLPQI